MCVFIDFWKLETENSILHVFSFFHKLSFENSFCFLPVLSCQISFLVSKIENCFWKQKIRGKNSYQTYPKIVPHVICLVLLYNLVPQKFYELLIWFLSFNSFQKGFTFLLLHADFGQEIWSTVLSSIASSD